MATTCNFGQVKDLRVTTICKGGKELLDKDCNLTVKSVTTSKVNTNSICARKGDEIVMESDLDIMGDLFASNMETMKLTLNEICSRDTNKVEVRDNLAVFGNIYAGEIPIIDSKHIEYGANVNVMIPNSNFVASSIEIKSQPCNGIIESVDLMTGNIAYTASQGGLDLFQYYVNDECGIKRCVTQFLCVEQPTVCQQFAGGQIGNTIYGETGNRLGQGVSLSADGLTVAQAAGTGYVSVYTWNGSSWVQKGSDVILGSRRVTLSNDGNTFVVCRNTDYSLAGVLRVFDWNGSSWVQRGSDIIGGAGDRFGESCWISGDGLTVVGGAIQTSLAPGYLAVYDWNGSNWIQRGTNMVGNTNGDTFGGTACAMTRDGNTVIGSSADNFFSPHSGYVKVFDWNGSAWVQRGSDIVGQTLGDQFGAYYIGIADDGISFVAGSPNNNTNGPFTGTMRVFEWSGSAWVQKGSTILGAPPPSYIFGFCTAISGDGNTIAANAEGFSGSGFEMGHVRVFRWNGSDWDEIREIIGEVDESFFGTPTALSQDGSIVAGSTQWSPANGSNAGYVVVYCVE